MKSKETYLLTRNLQKASEVQRCCLPDVPDDFAYAVKVVAWGLCNLTQKDLESARLPLPPAGHDWHEIGLLLNRWGMGILKASSKNDCERARLVEEEDGTIYDSRLDEDLT